MTDKQSLEDGSETTLAQAEAAFQSAMISIGRAQERLRDWVLGGEVPDTGDIKMAIERLGRTWRSAQTERDRVAETRRKNGELVHGDLDFDAARTAVCIQLDRIARSLAKG